MPQVPKWLPGWYQYLDNCQYVLIQPGYIGAYCIQQDCDNRGQTISVNNTGHFQEHVLWIIIYIRLFCVKYRKLISATVTNKYNFV